MKHVPSFIHIHNNTGLVPSNGGSFMDTVQAKECGDTTLADREWIYNQTSQSLKHAASGLCLDAGTQISLDCWSASSPNSAHPMCNPSLSAEARAKDFVRTRCYYYTSGGIFILSILYIHTHTHTHKRITHTYIYWGGGWVSTVQWFCLCSDKM